MSRELCTINVFCCDSKEQSLAPLDIAGLTVLHRYSHNGQYCTTMQRMIQN